MKHVRTEFEFQVDAPYAAVAPLFGAHEERRWAAGWSPRFIHPDPPADVEGAVFIVDSAQPAVWVNTIFDLDDGRVQYVNFAAGSVVTRIDIRLGRRAGATTVCVAYERTATSPSALELLSELAAADGRKAPEWEAEIRACLQTTTA